MDLTGVFGDKRFVGGGDDLPSSNGCCTGVTSNRDILRVFGV